MQSGRSAALVEVAEAKVTLTLSVRGRRPDGYHEIVSLVAFAGHGDRLRLRPGKATRLRLGGPFAAALPASGEGNLVLRAAALWRDHGPGLATGSFHLDKRLPVAAGLGGGSADAAAALRLLARANAGRESLPPLAEIAVRLGADVRVCLASRAAVMWGFGDQVAAAPPLPPVFAVLAHPGVALATAAVYAALDAPRQAQVPSPRPAVPGPFAAAAALAAHVAGTGNDLLPAALGLAPVIGDVLAALTSCPGCLAAQMAGSGASCFGLFANRPAAEAAANRVSAAHPAWWVVATELH